MKIGFIGAGNMGSALAKAAVKSGALVYIYDKDEEKAKKLADSLGASFKENSVIAAECDYIFLAVKPNIIPIAIKEISEGLNANSHGVLVSMAAGVAISKIEESKKDYPIIRISVYHYFIVNALKGNGFNKTV